MVRDEFQVHLLNKQGIARATQLAEVFSNTLNTLELLCGIGSREMALVTTKLQEASFFAKRAIAIHPDNQKEA